jgi:uncharacterized membrane protein
MSRFFITLGIIFIVLGLIYPLLAKLGLGRLPGDIYIETQNIKFYFPLGTSILVSLILSLIFWLFRH